MSNKQILPAGWCRVKNVSSANNGKDWYLHSETGMTSLIPPIADFELENKDHNTNYDNVNNDNEIGADTDNSNIDDPTPRKKRKVVDAPGSPGSFWGKRHYGNETGIRRHLVGAPFPKADDEIDEAAESPLVFDPQIPPPPKKPKM